MRRRSATPGLAQRCVDLRHRSAHPGCPTATTTCAGCSTTRTSRRVTLKGAERPQRVSLPAKPPLGSEPMYTHTRRQRVLTVPEAVLRWSRSVAVPPAAEECAPHKGRVEVLRLHMPQTGFSQTAVTVSLGGARSNRPSGPFLSQARRLRAPAHCFPRKGAVRLGPPIAPAGRKYHPVHVLPAATVARDDPGS
jgi:hypothetical protein